MGYKVEAEIWKVVDGNEIELMYNGVVFRRIDHLLITETRTASQETVHVQKFERIKKPGKRVRDSVADSIFEQTGHGIMEKILDALRDYLLTGFRTEKQLIDWMQQTIGHKRDYSSKRIKDYIHYLDSHAWLDTQLINGENAYRLRVK
jgi:hypothetical protein